MRADLVANSKEENVSWTVKALRWRTDVGGRDGGYRVSGLLDLYKKCSNHSVKEHLGREEKGDG